jgi:peptidoglycan/LPS O-acetylase OafA/YrhL
MCFPVLGLVAFVSGHGLNVSLVDALPRFLPEFIWGICTARLVPIFADSLPTAAFAIAGLLVVLIGVLCSLDTFAVAGLWLALASITMHADAERPPLLRKLPILRFFGLLSYSFYMSFGTSELVIGQIFRQLGCDPSVDKLTYLTAMTLLTFCIAIFMHVLVEKPCRRMADRWLAEPDPLAGRGVRM